MKIKYKDMEWDSERTVLLDFVSEKGLSGIIVARHTTKATGGATVRLIDLSEEVSEGVVELLDWSDMDARKVFWHSTSHLLAYAIKNLYPGAKPTIGPPIEEGFYYDFDNLSISMDDFERIEKEMKRLAEKGFRPRKEIVSFEKVKELYSDNPYKIEIAREAMERGEELSIYWMGDFYDLCRGPHVPSTDMIKAIKLTKLAAAYWKGDASNPQLTRIYGISFPSEDMLGEWIEYQEELKKRDHRVIGEQLDLYQFHPLSPGTPTFHWKGWRIYRALEEFIRELIEEGEYVEVRTPILWNTSLWKQSGHWDHYKENMYFVKIDNELYGLKPMNCPAHCMIYKSRVRSYRELPLRMAEFGHVHRHELSGTLSGLFRVRAFTQDDAHIFAREDQIEDEILSLLKMADRVYSTVGMEYRVMLSTRPEKYMGSLEMWNRAEEALKSALEKAGMEYSINEGDGAFYGPKIDMQVRDSIGRWWQCATIQLDFQMPIRFDLRYMGEDGTTEHRPVMIHRAIYGSIERFLGVLVENFAGKLPLWLSPEHVRIVPVSDRHVEKAFELRKKLRKRRFWAEVDDRDASIGKKIREAQLEKVNYVAVIGDREIESGTVSVRARDGLFNLSVGEEDFLSLLDEERIKRMISPDVEKWKEAAK